jgi:peptidylprolyl isomerase
MRKAQVGDRVKVHYTGSLSDGTVFDSSLESEPIEFTLGQGEIIPGFENMIIGMEIGETKKSTIPCEEAYGEFNEDWVVRVPKSQLPANFQPQLGRHYEIAFGDSEPVDFFVVEIDDESVTFDGNHPLAGQDLTFEVKLIEII